jgi:hypothetical protein
MLQLLTAAVEALNIGQVINLPTVWGAMVSSELQVARTATQQVYADTTDDFRTCRTVCVAEAVHQVGARRVPAPLVANNPWPVQATVDGSVDGRVRDVLLSGQLLLSNNSQQC